MLNIVVVDDSREDLVHVERALRQCKLLNPIQRFQSASQCAEYLLSDQQKKSYVLLLVDVVMAPESGMDLIRTVGESDLSSRVLVVMISGLSDLKAINEGYQLGAKTFLLKPVNRDDVVQVLNSLGDRILIEQTTEGYRLHHTDEDTDGIGNEARVLSLFK